MFFGKIISIRLHEQQIYALEEIYDMGDYESWSHIIRCAIIELLNCKRGQEELENRRIRTKD